MYVLGFYRRQRVCGTLFISWALFLSVYMVSVVLTGKLVYGPFFRSFLHFLHPGYTYSSNSNPPLESLTPTLPNIQAMKKKNTKPISPPAPCPHPGSPPAQSNPAKTLNPSPPSQHRVPPQPRHPQSTQYNRRTQSANLSLFLRLPASPPFPPPTPPSFSSPDPPPPTPRSIPAVPPSVLVVSRPDTIITSLLRPPDAICAPPRSFPPISPTREPASPRASDVSLASSPTAPATCPCSEVGTRGALLRCPWTFLVAWGGGETGRGDLMPFLRAAAARAFW